MKWSLFLTLTLTSLTTVSTTVYALGSGWKSEPVSTQKVLKRAQELKLGSTNLQRRALADLKKLSDLQRDELIQNKMEITDEMRSQLLSIKDGHTEVEKAKMIAQMFIYQYVQKNWSQFQHTALNESAADKFEDYKPELKQTLLEQIKYQPQAETLQKIQEFEFQISDWAKVSVSKDLKTLKYMVDLSTPGDGNRLDPIAKDLKSE